MRELYRDIQNPYNSSIMFASLIYFLRRVISTKNINPLSIMAAYSETNFMDLTLSFICEKIDFQKFINTNSVFVEILLRTKKKIQFYRNDKSNFQTFKI